MRTRPVFESKLAAAPAVLACLLLGAALPARASDAAAPGSEGEPYNLDFAHTALNYATFSVVLDIPLCTVAFVALFHEDTSFGVTHPTSISAAGFRLSGAITAKGVSEGLAKASGLEPRKGLTAPAGLFMGLSIGAMTPALVSLTLLGLICGMNDHHVPGGPWDEARGVVIATGALMASAMVMHALSVSLYLKEARRHIAALEPGAAPVALRRRPVSVSVQPWIDREHVGLGVVGRW